MTQASFPFTKNSHVAVCT